MIMVIEDAVLVACYDDVSPKEALQAYIEDIFPLSTNYNIVINDDGAAICECNGRKYAAFIYLEDF